MLVLVKNHIQVIILIEVNRPNSQARRFQMVKLSDSHLVDVALNHQVAELVV